MSGVLIHYIRHNKFVTSSETLFFKKLNNPKIGIKDEYFFRLNCVVLNSSFYYIFFLLNLDIF